MRNRSGWKHWLLTGLALLSGAGYVQGQTGSPNFAGAWLRGAPAMSGGMNGLGITVPMSIAMPGPPPMEVAYASGPGRWVLESCLPAPLVAEAVLVARVPDTSPSIATAQAWVWAWVALAVAKMEPVPFVEPIHVCWQCTDSQSLPRCWSRFTTLQQRWLLCVRWGNNAILPGRLTGLLGFLRPYGEGSQSQRGLTSM